MIDKVLIAEDHQSATISIQKTLDDLGIRDADYVYYCDDALSRIKTASQLQHPYDLLITDLYFEDDGRAQSIPGGIELIAAARQLQPELKVLVFSAESKPAVLELLFNTHTVDGYVRKARNDAKELYHAITELAKHQRYLPRHLSQLIKQMNSYNFADRDIAIISALANGIPQNKIPGHLEKQNIKLGLSSVEKRLAQIKSALEFSKNEQLVAYCKDMGII
jgi:two-component system, NarL family, captular synthesis response regulator RcsB